MAERLGHEELQRRHFDRHGNQYPRTAVCRPPLHTELETRALIDRLRGLPRGAPVADFGAGTGRLAIPLARAGYDVLAVDTSASALAVLRATADELGVGSIRTGSELPSNRSFAAVVGADVLHHVSHEDSLPAIHAALLPGGIAVFSEPGGRNPSWYAFFALRGELRVERGVVSSTPPRLRRVFVRHGFSAVGISGLGLAPRPLVAFSRRACLWNDGLGDLPGLRSVAYRYLVEARAAPLSSSARGGGGEEVLVAADDAVQPERRDDVVA